ncbi:helix-turn-helix domain-containing protein [Bacillus benzoevorans]|uniref:DNA-directed RNA polymerase specialized sigma subunit n=1 Tax=Bacillus benzoevorans TaxID=1456 RepID=A0A7X0HUD5_9BACI|nr:helix-turn-helix domain-containing protein [Bacillus benzoevorans]MBB6447008.1 DNA-directed RNA polymerase specialized sigma subunit [Bacillus benzoevorans]
MGFLTIGIGLAVAVYFLCEGFFKNIKNPGSKNEFESLENDEQELIKANELHQYLGITKEDVRELMKAHSDIPHISINGKTYYAKEKVREWLFNMSD